MPLNSLSRLDSLLGFFAWFTLLPRCPPWRGLPSGGAVSVKEASGVQAGQLQSIDGAGFARGYADVVANRPKVLPEVDISLREPRFSEGEMFLMFS